jgi:hypothetical protein
MQTGSCLCGAVAFAFDGPACAPIACHCEQCRRQSGHAFAATGVAETELTWRRQAGLAWYRASDIASRGFCRICGSTLFWKPDSGGTIMVAMGSLDAPTGLRLDRHVWVSCKGDYYDIADGLPQQDR